MKRIMMMLCLMSLLLTTLPVGVLATETTEAEMIIREPGQCGEDLTWSFDGGTLTISGSGEMDDYADSDAPWLEYKDSITKLVFTGDVTSVGTCAFTDYDMLVEVDFGSAMHTIHYRAFKSCDGLMSITLPATFRRFGEESFMSCQSLTEIRCRGGMPSFNANCVWDTYCSVFYPANNPWPAEPVMQLFQAFQGRVQFFMGEGTAETSAEAVQPATKPAETEPPATEPAQTVPETTAPEATQAETEPATEAAMVTEETQAPTTEETEEPTAAETEPEWIRETQPIPEKKGGDFRGIWVGLVLIAGTLSLLLIGALIFRRRRY